MKTRDVDIRNSLENYITNKFSYDNSTKIVHELNVCYGSARVDLAAINGSFHGYEIKSDVDTLERLPLQVENYNQVFDHMTLVCSEKFVAEAEKIIPEWWGIYKAAVDEDKKVNISIYRDTKTNNSVDAFALTQFLWKEEVINILGRLGADKKISRLPKYKLWALLADICPLDSLKVYVRTCLKQRENWRLD